MSKSVLLVDDQPQVRKSLRAFLEGKGVRVIEAKNGLDGLNKLSEHAPDYCLIDHHMPIMDGTTLLKNIRESKHLAKVPAILMTTESRQQVLPKISRYQQTHCLEKPIDLELLSSLVQEF